MIRVIEHRERRNWRRNRQRRDRNNIEDVRIIVDALINFRC